VKNRKGIGVSSFFLYASLRPSAVSRRSANYLGHFGYEANLIDIAAVYKRIGDD
jgi:hypothetical protein